MDLDQIRNTHHEGKQIRNRSIQTSMLLLLEQNSKKITLKLDRTDTALILSRSPRSDALIISRHTNQYANNLILDNFFFHSFFNN